ncbi:DNA-directed RNA polymerases I, II, and III subunit RPABC4 [Trichoplax sp. H2]|nr:DNA-directed RNA polymerases I, II, and III subunit RPABC4 [Trichoplax sp. H2]|eukprot:RDD45906.1 DNA-directed RNA polymerases I, II, and III subunit RPABC4 [Trichoplax sp. H2]
MEAAEQTASTSTSTQPSTANANKISIKYICGDCRMENDIKPRDPIRCRECGCRILYKKRTKRIVVSVDRFGQVDLEDIESIVVQTNGFLYHRFIQSDCWL